MHKWSANCMEDVNVVLLNVMPDVIQRLARKLISPKKPERIHLKYIQVTIKHFLAPMATL